MNKGRHCKVEEKLNLKDSQLIKNTS